MTTYCNPVVPSCYEKVDNILTENDGSFSPGDYGAFDLCTSIKRWDEMQNLGASDGPSASNETGGNYNREFDDNEPPMDNCCALIVYEGANVNREVCDDLQTPCNDIGILTVDENGGNLNWESYDGYGILPLNSFAESDHSSDEDYSHHSQLNKTRQRRRWWSTESKSGKGDRGM
jgi:hypothetical protein